MGFFSHRRRKSHLKTSSDHVRAPSSQGTEIFARPQSAPPQDHWDEHHRPTKPPRPHRGESLYSFPPPPPLWDCPEDFDRVSRSRSRESVTRPPPSRFSQQSSPREVPAAQSSLQDVVGDKLSEIISLIDEDAYHGSSPDLIINVPSPANSPYELESTPITAGLERTLVNSVSPQHRYSARAPSYQNPSRAERSINFLAKVSHYSNSRLPPNLPPLRVYLPTWPIFCLAAQYSSSAYSTPDSSDWSDRSSCYIPANPATGTKAMVIKSVPCDSKKTIVFAIRGTSVLSLRDWNINLSTKPTSPVGFLDDTGNLCHAGFLRVARAMIAPIAARIRQLLQQNPSRSQCSLLITGHSAGGAVAALLYAHMLSESVTSELTLLTTCFKRVHCVTFGAPPVSLLPLSKPANAEERLRKCLFYSFINEGDPVVRAEKSYVRSLVDLVTTQLPTSKSDGMRKLANSLSKFELESIPAVAAEGREQLRKMANRPPMNKLTNHPISAEYLQSVGQSLGPLIPVDIPDEKEVVVSKGSGGSYNHQPVWNLPPSTLSNAGRLVVLRVAPQPPSSRQTSPDLAALSKKQHELETVHAETLSNSQLHGIVFGDPLLHGMDVYRRRVEALAMKAVTCRNMQP